jgi:naphthoate synthase
MVSTIFTADEWTEITSLSFSDITYHRSKSTGTLRIAFNRPEVRNAFRPQTVDELLVALHDAAQRPDILDLKGFTFLRFRDLYDLFQKLFYA